MNRLNSLAKVVVLLLLIQNLAASRLLAQADSKNAAGLAWRDVTLRQLSDRLGDDQVSAAERLEFQARHQWLSGWRPGQMTAIPATSNQVPEKRLEPILKSRHSERIERELSNLRNPSAPKQHAFLKQQAKLHSNDVAVQQLFLRWMDDDNTRRKDYLTEIESLTRHLAHSLQKQVKGAKSEGLDAEGTGRRTLAYEFTLYRRVRSLAYRELPDVVERHPIEDQAWLDQAINDAFQELQRASGGDRTEFGLIKIRILRRQGNYGTALVMLERFGKTISQEWFLKKRRDILKQLDWPAPFQEAASIYAEHFPPE